MSRFDFMKWRLESPLQVRETPSISHPHAQRSAFHRCDACQQRRSFARWNQSLSESKDDDPLPEKSAAIVDEAQRYRPLW